MMKVKKLVRILSLRQLRDFIRSSAVVRRFADAHSLVYFGSVGRDDESKIVKGITLSNTYRDSHYLVGTDYGRDIIFLQRSDVVHSANYARTESYTWNILAIDLANSIRLPHVYVEGRARHSHGFYETLSMKSRELIELPRQLFSAYDPLFSQRFTVRTLSMASHELPALLTPERAAVLAHHFSMFDYEWHDDVLYVYFLSARPSLHYLELMLKAGVWLAGELDSSIQYRHE